MRQRSQSSLPEPQSQSPWQMHCVGARFRWQAAGGQPGCGPLCFPMMKARPYGGAAAMAAAGLLGRFVYEQRVVLSVWGTLASCWEVQVSAPRTNPHLSWRPTFNFPGVVLPPSNLRDGFSPPTSRIEEENRGKRISASFQSSLLQKTGFII